jgi:outer membrane biosynthesis protein TonB
MIKQTTVLIAILALIAGGMSILASEGNPVAYAAPRIQETEPPRPTPTNEPRPTSTPEPPPTNTPEPPPTNTPEQEPTNTPLPVPPTNAPIPPTNEPEPTSKPKKQHKSSDSSSPTSVPPAPAVAVSDSVPSTGFGSVGGWTLGVTGLILVCVLIVARRLRIGKGNRTGRSDTYGEPGKHRHP